MYPVYVVLGYKDVLIASDLLKEKVMRQCVHDCSTDKCTMNCTDVHVCCRSKVLYITRASQVQTFLTCRCTNGVLLYVTEVLRHIDSYRHSYSQTDVNIGCLFIKLQTCISAN